MVDKVVLQVCNPKMVELFVLLLIHVEQQNIADGTLDVVEVDPGCPFLLSWQGTSLLQMHILWTQYCGNPLQTYEDRKQEHPNLQQNTENQPPNLSTTTSTIFPFHTKKCWCQNNILSTFYPLKNCQRAISVNDKNRRFLIIFSENLLLATN